jgi:predicted Zn-dependent protease
MLLLLAAVCSGCLLLLGGEQRAGDQAAREIEGQVGLVRAPDLEAYVGQIGGRLAAESGRDGPWRFVILDDPMPNAFALPGGHVYVTRGLLALVNSEDELAGVIGHEIGHVLAGHGGKRATLSAPFALLTGITSYATGLVVPRLGRAVSDAGHVLSQGLVVAPFSRQQEREADRLGQGLAARAGWDPRGISAFLETLGRATTLLLGEERRAGWLDTHPTTPERVRKTAARANELERVARPPIARDRSDLLGRLDGILVGRDVAHGLPVGRRFVRPDWRISVEWPAEWQPDGNAAAIAAQPPSGEALVGIRVEAEGNDPRAVVEALEAALGAPIEVDEVSLGGVRALRHRGRERVRDGFIYHESTWVAMNDRIFRVIALCDERDAASWQPVFGDLAESLRPATSEELGSFEDKRLRSMRAQQGESVSAFARRSGSAWTAEQIEVANALETGAGLDGEPLLKITRSEPFEQRRP